MTGTHATDWTGRIIMPFGICNAVRSRCVCTFIHFNVFNVNVYIAYRVCAFHECGFHLEHCTARKQNREREKNSAQNLHTSAMLNLCAKKKGHHDSGHDSGSLSLSHFSLQRPVMQKAHSSLCVFFSLSFHSLFTVH